MTSIEEYLEDIGRNRLLSLVSGFMGPDPKRFSGRWQEIPYWMFKRFTDFAVVFNLITIAINFFSPGIPLIVRCLSGFPLMTLTMAFLRMLYDWLQRPKFSALVKSYMASESGNVQPIHFQNALDESKKLIRPFAIVLLMCMCAPMTPWCAIPFFSEDRQVSVPAYFPFDPTSSPAFELVTFMQVCGATFTPMKIIGFDDIFYTLTARQLAEFKHLRHSLGYLLSGTTGLSEPALAGKLKIWIKNHQEAIRMQYELQRLYSPSLCIQFALQALLLCINAFVVAAAPIDAVQLFFCAVYVVGNAFELLFTCRMGDLLYYASSDIVDDVIGKPWYTLDPSPQGHVLPILKVILARCQRPIRMSALGVFPLDVDTFRAVMLSSYSYFTVLAKLKKTIEPIE